MCMCIGGGRGRGAIAHPKFGQGSMHCPPTFKETCNIGHKKSKG